MDKKARRENDGRRAVVEADRPAGTARTNGGEEGGRTLESASGGGDADLDLRTRGRGGRIGRGWERQRDAREIARRASRSRRRRAFGV